VKRIARIAKTHGDAAYVTLPSLAAEGSDGAVP
jgi:hypothetical protein